MILNSLRVSITLNVFAYVVLGSRLYLTKSIDIVSILLLLANAYLSYHIINLFIPFVRGIPMVMPNSIIGFSSALFGQENADSHTKMLEVAEKYGKLAQFKLFGESVVVINDKVMAKVALKEVIGKGSIHRGNPHVNHRNIFNLDTNDDWLLRRNLFRGAFSMNQLRAQSDIIASLCLKLLSALELYADYDKPVQLDKLFGQLTMDVICNVAFQFDMNALGNSDEFELLHESLRVQFESSIVPRMPFANILLNLPLYPFMRYKKAKNATTSFSKKILNHLRQLNDKGSLKPNSFGEAVMSFASTPGITEDDVLSEITLMFVAGHETTAHTLSWFIYALAKYPNIQQRVKEEMNKETIRESRKIVLSSELPPYVEAVLKESMRRYPVAVFGSFRQVKDNNFVVEYNDRSYKIPKGAWVLVNSYVLHNWDENWGSDVAEFIPERWLQASASDTGSHPDVKTQPIPANPLSSPAIYGGGGMSKDELMFAPFSFGPRNCLGMNLALLESKFMISDLVGKFTFKLANLDMHDEGKALESYFTLRPLDKLPVFVYATKA